jgi:hypothetical protein
MKSRVPRLPGRTPREKKVAQRAAAVKSVYGMKYEDYCSLYVYQHGMCAICGCDLALLNESDGPPIASVDHDHETGEVRGLLCGKCNKGLGFFNDDWELMNDAIDYLLEHATLS